MSPLLLIYYVQLVVEFAMAAIFCGMGVYAFIEALRATDYAYESAFKRTKKFWMAVTGASAVALVLNLLMVARIGHSSLFITLIAATAAGVFLADVRPAVAVRRRR
ncbi:DUF2516 family protein [Rothia terrae]|uniref:DUF2516 family protein n=1 Tax=Rothia terrae TaxID=396015 RepID=A0A7H2BCU9_9MICC|nr:DUF2516 family protein [Rothia terrae]QNV37495.1 DUF2516 family protein [Rothia terrae]